MAFSGAAGAARAFSGSAAGPPATPFSRTFGTGLTDDGTTVTSDLATGKSGGQTLTGGMGSAEKLTLRSTSHATKGKIYFGAAERSYYDEEEGATGGAGLGTPLLMLNQRASADYVNVHFAINGTAKGKMTATSLGNVAITATGSGDVSLYAGDYANQIIKCSTSGLHHLNVGLGFFGADPVAKPTVSGSRGGNAALADLLTELATMGLITNSTSA